MDDTEIGENIAVREALDWYLDARASELSDATHRSHRYRLTPFVEWCESNELTTADITPRSIHRYRSHRTEEADLSITTIHTQLSTIRVFLGWCDDHGLVMGGIHDAVDVPVLPRSAGARNSTLEYERGERILEYLDRYEYASFGHVCMLILVKTGVRIGAVRSLDVEDFDTDERLLYFEHRPETDTPLKNGERGARPVSVSPQSVEIIEDYIDVNRYDVTDEDGRRPLLTTEHGRPAASWLRRVVYRCTQPCLYGECPHNRLESECEDVGYTQTTGCPSSRPPHDVRRGVITHYRREEIPAQAIVDRANVSERTLMKHYDVRSPTEKARQRRKFFDGGNH